MLNKTIFLFIVSLFFAVHNIYPQSNAELFIKDLINYEDVTSYIDKDELQRSQRLGINYTGVNNKFLISYDIDDAVKSEIKGKNTAYNINEKMLEDSYSVIEFSVPSLNYNKNFYLKDGKFISPPSYFSKNWQTKESRYFVFKISEPRLFNDYCTKKLDEFVDSMCVMLQIDESRRQQLEKEKIYYLMCKDDNEIEKLTGYKARGIFITAFDEIISTYNTHFHELSHFLINYKLQNLSLNTLPFFLEGFANAFGGRGGISNRVVLDLGVYLQKSGFITYDSLITFDKFYNEDASLTYPVAGLYNLFLFKKLGTDKYLELYKEVNGKLEDIKSFRVEKISLPGKDEFDNFLKEYEENASILVDEPKNEDEYYKFSIDGPFFYTPEDLTNIPADYISKKYNDIFKKSPDEICKYKYGIVADSLSVSIYNFYTNDIIASYSINFSIDRIHVPFINGKYEFYVKKDLFDEDIKR
ncbi:MAG: hypothetical protein EHM58_16030 [Ignavibacteriae bacterium]|nr:MAG: hypothetical protein EHM58_16030 [Ignavibacteriota bacterium]